jgi:beta-galactosidase
MGLGGINSWGAKPLDAYMNFSRDTYQHSFRLSPIKHKINDPTLLAGLGFKNLPTSNQTIPYPTIPTAADTLEPFVQSTIPGVIQAENYDRGGEGVAYHDLDMINSGNHYRTDGVDIDANDGDGYAVGWTMAGEWLKYSIDITSPVAYDFTARVSAGGDGGSFYLLLDDIPITDTIPVPNTESWGTYTTVQGTTSLLTSGKNILTLQVTGSYFNIDWIMFEETPPVTLQSPGSITFNGGLYRIYNVHGVFLGELTLPPSADIAKEFTNYISKPGAYILKPSGTNSHLPNKFLFIKAE